MKLLASLRLSNDTDETNSPETQKGTITEYADDNEHTVVHWAEDLDVSGAVPIRQREGIGPYLAEARLGEWDAIAGHELDRLFRDMRDFVNFARDMKEKHGKYVIDVSDGTTSKTTAGMQILEDRALAAERERMRMAKRRSLAAKGIRLDGRWNGGLCPFGYAPVGVPGKGKRQRLVKDDVYAPVLKRMVTDTLAGKSLEFIARWLNAEGVPTATDIGRMRYGRPAKNTGWKAQSVRAVLNNRAMTGVTTYNGEIVRGNRLLTMRNGRQCR